MPDSLNSNDQSIDDLLNLFQQSLDQIDSLLELCRKYEALVDKAHQTIQTYKELNTELTRLCQLLQTTLQNEATDKLKTIDAITDAVRFPNLN